ncbi:MAG: hypothetical protein ACT4QG_03985 [Sporichthyaceae bacterium]
MTNLVQWKVERGTTVPGQRSRAAHAAPAPAVEIAEPVVFAEPEPSRMTWQEAYGLGFALSFGLLLLSGLFGR